MRVGRLWPLLVLLTLLMVPLDVAETQTTRAAGPGSLPGFETAPNDASTGTVQHRLAKFTAAGTLIRANTGDTAMSLYVCQDGCSTTGYATYRSIGLTLCEFDNTTTAKGNTFVTAGTNGQCHQQDAPPTSGYVVGKLIGPNTTAGQKSLIIADNQNYSPGSGAGTGTVTSIQIAVPPEWTSTGGPITNSGTITIGEATEPANTVYAGPTAGGAVTPGFRTLVAADLPGGIPPGGACGGDTGGTYPNCTVLKASGTFAWAGKVAPSTLTGDINDYNGCTGMVCNINGGATDRNVTGLVAPATDGDLKNVCNSGTTANLVLKDQNAGSSAANRFALTADVTLIPSACHLLRYDAAPTSRYRSVLNSVPDPLAQKPCALEFGSVNPSSAPLEDAEDQPATCSNRFGRPWKMTGLFCKANAGAPTILPVLTGGATTSILSGGTPCTCGTAWTACTLNGTPVLNSFDNNGASATCTTTPCTLDANIQVSGGVATRLQIEFTGSIQK